MTISINQKAPAFTLLSDNEEKVSLSQFEGKKVVIFFYPKDNTPGCTKESCEFNTSLSGFQKYNTQILGVSKDSVKSHQKFRDKFSFEFPLLSDPEAVMCEAYGVWTQKSMFGKKYMGIERSTFLIDEQGKLIKEWRKVKVPGHVEEVLLAVKRLS